MAWAALAATAAPLLKKGATAALGSLGGGEGKGKENVVGQSIIEDKQTKRAQRAKPPSDEEVRQKMQQSLAISAQNLKKAP